MPAIGSLQVRAYTSRARIPVEDVAVTVVDEEGRLLGLRLTDDSGLTTPIRIEVPDAENSQAPGSDGPPFRTVNLYARAEDYEQILVEDVQVFAGTVTAQDLNLIPLPEYPDDGNRGEVFVTTPQNL